jgi:integrase
MLTQRQVDTASSGTHIDQPNLYLRVTPKGSRSWVFRYTDKRKGKVAEIVVGTTDTIELKAVRDLVYDMRVEAKAGRDPRVILTPAPVLNPLTFKDHAEQVIKDKSEGLHKHKYIKQWSSTLETYAYSSIGTKPPKEITITDILAILRPLWPVKTETAKRLRQRIETVLDAAAIMDADLARPNPARWTGVLSKVLQPPHKVTPITHHPSAPYADLPRIMAALATKDHTSALCLKFIILTACRSGEARGADWSEIDLEASLWTIPVGRMKAGREHRVSLSDEAIKILKVMRERNPQPKKPVGRVFPGERGGLLSDVAVNKTLHLIAPGVTVHGFRSSFRVWGAEQTDFPSEALELCLAHRTEGETVRAYQRSDLIDKRKAIMQSWSNYCTAKPKDN